jgi:hypothetical protein
MGEKEIHLELQALHLLLPNPGKRPWFKVPVQEHQCGIVRWTGILKEPNHHHLSLPLFLPTASSGPAALPLLQGSWGPKGPCHGWGNLREPVSSLSFPPCFLVVSQFHELLRAWEETNDLRIWDLGTWLLLTREQPCHCPWGLPAWLALWIFLLNSLCLLSYWIYYSGF